ncbi:MAG: ferredoxin [Gammaproteobacteria bacterium]|nr:ferredoxin [Gammaproteobacteria bacterium]|tara:strand:- start:7230 stop:8183 length:954 start_codon:yes stop_codon:yes gene_type:complete
MNELNDLKLLVSQKTEVAAGILEFQFVAGDGSVLPSFQPGSHVAIATPCGANRQYSLINDGKEPTFYQIAVKLEPQSRGGSQSMHEQLNVGHSVLVQPPDNSFPLLDAPGYLLIGGGIGITPLIGMAKTCRSNGKPFRLIYCARSEGQAAYWEDLKNTFDESVVIHFDDGDPEKVYDFWDEFMIPNANHVYCCGPRPLMDEIKALSGHWPEQQIHFEDFNPQSGLEYVNLPFTVSIKSAGESFEVHETATILETLRSHGLRVPSSCESGTCGSCKMKLLSGSVEHRDFVLESEEYESAIMVCVSRGRGNIEIDFEDF